MLLVPFDLYDSQFDSGAAILKPDSCMIFRRLEIL